MMKYHFKDLLHSYYVHGLKNEVPMIKITSRTYKGFQKHRYDGQKDEKTTKYTSERREMKAQENRGWRRVPATILRARCLRSLGFSDTSLYIQYMRHPPLRMSSVSPSVHFSKPFSPSIHPSVIST